MIMSKISFSIYKIRGRVALLLLVFYYYYYYYLLLSWFMYGDGAVMVTSLDGCVSCIITPTPLRNT